MLGAFGHPRINKKRTTEVTQWKNGASFTCMQAKQSQAEDEINQHLMNWVVRTKYLQSICIDDIKYTWEYNENELTRVKPQNRVPYELSLELHRAPRCSYNHLPRVRQKFFLLQGTTPTKSTYASGMVCGTPDFLYTFLVEMKNGQSMNMDSRG